MNAHRLEARRWFRQAKADLAVVYTLRSGGHFAATCFHSQQAAEKALKAVLYAQGARVVVGHSIRELARQCEAHDEVFSNLREGAALLDQFYIPTRYPNGLPVPAIPDETFTESQAKMAQEVANKVVYVVETFLRTLGDVLD